MKELIHKLMTDAITEGVFPGASLLVANQYKIAFYDHYGQTQIDGKPVDNTTVFDLASLTKPLATSLSILHMVQTGMIQLNQKISTIFSDIMETETSEITIRQLLCHQSGLPAHRPYYKKLIDILHHKRSDSLLQMIFDEPLEYTPGQNTEYSDLGFMILDAVIKRVAGCRLDEYVFQNIYHPLGLNAPYFIDLFAQTDIQNINFAATEECPWRKRMLMGEVHDDNASVLGGICGHAGLFGTACDVYQILNILLRIYHDCPEQKNAHHVINRQWLCTFFQVPDGAQRPLGFDCPTPPKSSSGKYFSSNSVGHLGFTGTSFWMDLDKSIIIILLTNRVHPNRNNIKIRSFRPRIHDVIMQNLIKSKI
jgi:CubicO group peptidase (beta-lactamase class C family)